MINIYVIKSDHLPMRAKSIDITVNKIRNIMKAQKIEDTESAYEFIGCLIDKKKGLVQIGDFIFNLDGNIPEEATERGFISFECCRVDIQSS